MGVSTQDANLDIGELQGAVLRICVPEQHQEAGRNEEPHAHDCSTPTPTTPTTKATPKPAKQHYLFGVIPTAREFTLGEVRGACTIS